MLIAGQIFALPERLEINVKYGSLVPSIEEAEVHHY